MRILYILYVQLADLTVGYWTFNFRFRM